MFAKSDILCFPDYYDYEFISTRQVFANGSFRWRYRLIFSRRNVTFGQEYFQAGKGSTVVS